MFDILGMRVCWQHSRAVYRWTIFLPGLVCKSFSLLVTGRLTASMFHSGHKSVFGATLSNWWSRYEPIHSSICCLAGSQHEAITVTSKMSTRKLDHCSKCNKNISREILYWRYIPEHFSVTLHYRSWDCLKEQSISLCVVRGASLTS